MVAKSAINNYFKAIIHIKTKIMEPFEETTNNANLRSKWLTAFERWKNYRDYLAKLPIEYDEKINSYLLTKEDIEVLLTQDKKNLDGIRVYIGHKHFKNGAAAVRLFIVATEKDSYGNYNDYDIPRKDEKEFKTMMGEERPCPHNCSNSNDLNDDRDIQ